MVSLRQRRNARLNARIETVEVRPPISSDGAVPAAATEANAYPLPSWLGSRRVGCTAVVLSR